MRTSFEVWITKGSFGSQQMPDPVLQREVLRWMPNAHSLKHWMKRLNASGVLMLFLSGSFCGCMNAQNTRFPSWAAYFPRAENAAYEQQDPFPDPDIGPSLDSTPRGYDRPRSEQRRAAEQRVFQGVPVGPEAVPPGVPQGGINRPRAVY
jgi:hypothetical protein